MQNLPYSLMAELEKVSRKTNPPVHLWQPEKEKKIDLVVRQSGVWEYEGSPITRVRLVRLFASVLRKEGSDYYLVTPAEKCLIDVEDVPFEIVLMNVLGEGKSRTISMTTNMGESFRIDENHPVTLRQYGSHTFPYVLVRNSMEGRINRNVYYQFGEFLEETERPGSEGQAFCFWSCNRCFYLSEPDAAS